MKRKGLRRRDVLRLRNCYEDLRRKGVGSILLLDVIFDLDNLGCEKEKERLDARCLHFPTKGGEGSAEVLPSPSQEPKEDREQDPDITDVGGAYE